MKGQRFPSETFAFLDPSTGTRVRRVTSAAAISHPTYFLQSSFTLDDAALFFTSYRTDTPQLFEADLTSGDLRQLTADAAIHAFSPALHPDGERILFVRGGEVWLVHRRTLEERRIAAFADAQLGEVSLSPDGNWIVAAIKQSGQQGLAVGRIDGTGWHLLPFPRTVIHPQFHPLEPEWIEFAGDPAPRMFRIRRDGTGLECLFEHDNNAFVVHETFLKTSGDLVFTVWPHRLCRMDWTTRAVTTIVETNAWHIAPDHAGRRILYDTNHPDTGIHVADVETGHTELVCLSRSSNQGSQWRKSRYAEAADFAAARSDALEGRNLSWMESAVDTVYGPQWTHPHPSWSRNESHIAYASDLTGTTQVYVAEIGSKLPSSATLAL